MYCSTTKSHWFIFLQVFILLFSPLFSHCSYPSQGHCQNFDCSSSLSTISASVQASLSPVCKSNPVIPMLKTLPGIPSAYRSKSNFPRLTNKDVQELTILFPDALGPSIQLFREGSGWLRLVFSGVWTWPMLWNSPLLLYEVHCPSPLTSPSYCVPFLGPFRLLLSWTTFFFCGATKTSLCGL